MIHYHVWFNLKPEITEEAGLQVVRKYLSGLSTSGDASDFQLLRNRGSAPRSKLPAYHALVEFTDSEALSAAMKKQAQQGIHTGPHGQIINVVCDFHVEVFASVFDAVGSDVSRACEI